MGIKRIRDLVVHTLNYECSTSFCIGKIWIKFLLGAWGGLKLTRETPPGECGRKVKLKGIEEARTRGGACGLIRYTRKTLPIFVSGVSLWDFVFFLISPIMTKILCVFLWCQTKKSSKLYNIFESEGVLV